MLDGIPLVGLTAPTLLGLCVLLLMTGRLVPRVYLVDKTQEAEKWRLAYEAERDARSRSDAQTVELLEVARTSHAIIEAMFTTVKQTGGTDVVQKP